MHGLSLDQRPIPKPASQWPAELNALMNILTHFNLRLIHSWKFGVGLSHQSCRKLIAGEDGDVTRGKGKSEQIKTSESLSKFSLCQLYKEYHTHWHAFIKVILFQLCFHYFYSNTKVHLSPSHKPSPFPTVQFHLMKTFIEPKIFQFFRRLPWWLRCKESAKWEILVRSLGQER